MRYLIGFIAGAATVIAALAIWPRRDEWTPEVHIDPAMYERPIDRGYGLGA